MISHSWNQSESHVKYFLDFWEMETIMNTYLTLKKLSKLKIYLALININLLQIFAYCY